VTNKQEKILDAALELFASEGYASTPTSKIAKKAGVSEGLIFRHFENKKGLLKALMGEAEERLGQLMGPILFENDPKTVIAKTISMPFMVIDQREHDFWKLQFILKWQPEYNNPGKMKPLLDKLSTAFAELGYAEPENEACLLSYIIDNISTEILKGNIEPGDQHMKTFLLKKYQL
jgi:AcrR family transcriptional regulator